MYFLVRLLQTFIVVLDKDPIFEPNLCWEEVRERSEVKKCKESEESIATDNKLCSTRIQHENEGTAEKSGVQKMSFLQVYSR